MICCFESIFLLASSLQFSSLHWKPLRDFLSAEQRLSWTESFPAYCLLAFALVWPRRWRVSSGLLRRRPSYSVILCSLLLADFLSHPAYSPLDVCLLRKVVWHFSLLLQECRSCSGGQKLFSWFVRLTRRNFASACLPLSMCACIFHSASLTFSSNVLLKSFIFSPASRISVSDCKSCNFFWAKKWFHWNHRYFHFSYYSWTVEASSKSVQSFIGLLVLVCSPCSGFIFVWWGLTILLGCKIKLCVSNSTKLHYKKSWEELMNLVFLCISIHVVTLVRTIINEQLQYSVSIILITEHSDYIICLLFI